MGLEPAVITFAAYSIGCLLVVLYVMARDEDIMTAILGLISAGIYAFVWGWRHSETEYVGRMRLGAVMTTWSWCLGAMAFYWLIMAPNG